jgi:hypothetical protein
MRHHLSRRLLPTAGAGLGAVITSIAISGCMIGGGGGSAAAVCKVWDTEGVALHNQFADAGSGQDPLAGLG